MLSTTFRIACKNLTLMYKVLVYVGVLVLIAAAVLFSVLTPLSQALLGDVDVWTVLQDAFAKMGEEGVAGFAAFWQQLGAFFSQHSAELWSMFGLLAVTMFIVKFFGCLVELPQAEVIACRMEKDYQQNFIGACIATFGRSVVYSLFYTLFTTPIDLGLTLGCYYLAIALRGALGIFVVPIVVLIYLFLLALRISLFSQWVPELVRGQGGAFRALKRSFVNIKGTLKVQLPVTYFLLVVGAVIVMSTALFTFGISILLVAPVYIMMQACSQLIVYFDKNDLKYYHN